jgi:putative membrane protein
VTEAEHQFKRLSPLTPLVRGSIVLVAVLGGTWRDLANGNLGPFALILLGVLVLGVIYGFASWLRTKYWIEGDELRVDTGVISRQSRRIRIDRLQGIDIVQPFVARLFGLAELKMDVAGGGKAEGSLAFMPVAEANELKELLLARRDASKHAITPDTPLEELPPPHIERQLAKLDLGTLLGSLLLSAEFVWLGFSAVVFAVLWLLAGSFGSVSGAIPVVGGLMLVIFHKLSGFYNFTVSDTAAGLQVRRGLFALTSQTIALPRVQGVVVCEPLLWRPFGWARLDVSIAGAATVGDQTEKELSTTLLPVGPRAQVMQLAQHVLGGLDLDAVPLTPPPARSGWVEPIGRFFLAAGLDESLVVSRGGWFRKKTHAVPHRRVQSLRLHQGPIQRKLRLANVYVDSPPGPVQVRLVHRDAASARPLFEQAAELARQARRGQPSVVDPDASR